jgi:putative ABC transport system permease protein
LRERDDVAIITPAFVSSTQRSDRPWVQVGDFQLEGFTLEDEHMPDVELALRPSETAGAVHKIKVIGVLEQDSARLLSALSYLAENRVASDRGIVANEQLIERVMGQPVAAATSYVFKVREGVNASEMAQALEKAFLPNGMDARVMAEIIAQGREIQRGFMQLFQGFAALGLLVGIAALGVISSRTVVERRQQVGVLRAIGYQPRMVALSFMLESSFVSLSGILIGTATGVLVGSRAANELFGSLAPGMTFPIPWLQIGGILLLAYVFSLITTILPAYQASRIYPAEALRYA